MRDRVTIWSRGSQQVGHMVRDRVYKAVTYERGMVRARWVNGPYARLCAYAFCFIDFPSVPKYVEELRTRTGDMVLGPGKSSP